MSHTLHGRWRPEGAQPGSEVPFTEVELRPDGRLRFSVRQPGGDDTTELSYRLENGWIITPAVDPGSKTELRTRFELQQDGSLVLEYGGHKGRYVRA